ncbi:MAG TPA: hypothetical protein VF385_01050 [Patescibacteria group bacterium]
MITINANQLITILIEGGAIISTMAALVAAVIMSQVTKKFGTGILASGFKTISIGVLFIALGILVDSVQSYLLTSGFDANNRIIIILLIAKLILFVLGTYTIVIGSKKTGDKLESLTK